MSQRFAERINEDHRAILAAIEAGDADAAAEEMRKRLSRPEPHVSEDVAPERPPGPPGGRYGHISMTWACQHVLAQVRQHQVRR